LGFFSAVKVNKEHLHNKIIREIIARIASGSYARGEKLPGERSLCEQFDVARGTLRKALSRLEEVGMVEIRPHSGVYVQRMRSAEAPSGFMPPDFDSVTLTDVIEARKAIEVPAVERACRSITPRQIENLRDFIDQMVSSMTDISRFLEADMLFHQTLVRAGGNAVMVRAFEAIYEYHRFSAAYTSQQEGEEAEAVEYHRRLLEALEKGQPHASRRILIEHLDSMEKYSRKRRRKRA
jgi:GntR family transcriptional repressor for pyruvate dehydrogenase complex